MLNPFFFSFTLHAKVDQQDLNINQMIKTLFV